MRIITRQTVRHETSVSDDGSMWRSRPIIEWKRTKCYRWGNDRSRPQPNRNSYQGILSTACIRSMCIFMHSHFYPGFYARHFIPTLVYFSVRRLSGLHKYVCEGCIYLAVSIWPHLNINYMAQACGLSVVMPRAIRYIHHYNIYLYFRSRTYNLHNGLLQK